MLDRKRLFLIKISLTVFLAALIVGGSALAGNKKSASITIQIIPVPKFAGPVTPETGTVITKKSAMNFIFLVDTSMSMIGRGGRGAVNIFPDVKNALKKFIDKSNIGDNLVIYTFDETIVLRAQVQIASDGDKEGLKSLIDGLEAKGLWTHIPSALDQGYKKCAEMKINFPQSIYAVVILTDAIQAERPNTQNNTLTLTDVMEKKGDEWFTFYVSLAKNPYDELKNAVKNDSLGIFIDAPSPSEIENALTKIRPKLETVINLNYDTGVFGNKKIKIRAGTDAAYQINALYSEGVLNKTVSIIAAGLLEPIKLSLEPSSFICSESPSISILKAEIPPTLKKGTYSLTLSFSVPAGMTINPPQLVYIFQFIPPLSPLLWLIPLILLGLGIIIYFYITRPLIDGKVKMKGDNKESTDLFDKKKSILFICLEGGETKKIFVSDKKINPISVKMIAGKIRGERKIYVENLASDNPDQVKLDGNILDINMKYELYDGAVIELESEKIEYENVMFPKSYDDTKFNLEVQNVRRG